MNSSLDKTTLTSSPIHLSRFDLIKTLGEGAVGAVYLVRDRERGNQEVALKTLVNEIDLDENTYQRFRQEIKILQELDHPNVIKAYDIIESDSYLSYTMEYINGSDLGQIYTNHSFSEIEVESIVAQLLSALSALHNKGIWHRDIKLENIMLTKEGVVKLADLGLVKNEFNKSFTRTGVLLGTAQYMPPEYVKESQYDARGDIYAVGVVLFEMLSNKRRFPNLPGNKIVEKLFSCGFKIPEDDLLTFSDKQKYIITKATNPNILQRYQTAEEMIIDLESKDLGDKLKDSKITGTQVKSTVNFQHLQGLKKKKNKSSLKYVLISLVSLLVIIVFVLLSLK